MSNYSFTNEFNNETTNLSSSTTGLGSNNDNVFESQLMIPLYLIIFVLSIAGNTLVLFTLMRNKRMKTVTNVYLLNLAVADLLLGIFCIPVTLVGQVLRTFIFGEIMCKMITYFQGVSVSVVIWTLVAISLERYFAICKPLKSRSWQTRNHASKMIAFVWWASLGWCGPILLVATLQSTNKGRHKCREDWSSKSNEQLYNLFLNIILFVVPLSIMSLAYFMIMDKLWKGLRKEIEHDSCQKLVAQKSNSSPNLNGHVVKKTMIAYSENGNSTICEKNATKTCLNCQNEQLNNRRTLSNNRYSCLFKDFSQMPPFAEQSIKPESLRKGRSLNEENDVMKESTYTFARHGIRSNYLDRSIEAKRKVIRMLFVIVAEFFICWTPLHILNTLYVYYPDEVYKTVGSTEVSLIHLLCYVSSCSNPITYCFMNRKFRQTFFTAFRCRTPCLPDTSVSVSNFEGRPKNVALKKQSENSCNDSTLFMGRISYSGRSDPEAEDRV